MTKVKVAGQTPTPEKESPTPEDKQWYKRTQWILQCSCHSYRRSTVEVRDKRYLVNNDSQDDDDQENGQDKQQDACLAACTLLVIARLLEIDLRALRGITRDVDVLLDAVELYALLVDHMGNISEQFIELANGLFDIADFGLALDDERLLEVDLIL